MVEELGVFTVTGNSLLVIDPSYEVSAANLTEESSLTCVNGSWTAFVIKNEQGCPIELWIKAGKVPASAKWNHTITEVTVSGTTVGFFDATAAENQLGSSEFMEKINACHDRNESMIFGFGAICSSVAVDEGQYSVDARLNAKGQAVEVKINLSESSDVN